MRVFGYAWKINFLENIFSWPCVLMALTRKLVSVKIFTSNHFRTHAQRERERERERGRRESPDHAFDFAGEPRAQITPRTISTPHTTRSELSHSNALLRPSSSPMTHTPPVSSIAAPRRLHRSRWSQHRADRTTPIKQRSTPTPLDLASATRSLLRLRCAISPLDRTQSPLSLPSSLNLTGFDDFFFWVLFLLWVCLVGGKMWVWNWVKLDYSLLSHLM